jgi:hypothetical protein
MMPMMTMTAMLLLFPAVPTLKVLYTGYRNVDYSLLLSISM